jgi:hypothetical protein
MKSFNTLINEAKAKVTYTEAFNHSKECSNLIPLRKTKIDSKYDTSALANILLDGGYVFTPNDKYISYFISAEDAAKIEGLTDILVKREGGDAFKIGSKTHRIDKWAFYNANKAVCSAKSFIITVEGDPIDNVVKSHYPQDMLDFMKDGKIVNCLKTDLSDSQINAIYGDKDEVGFYYKIFDGQYKIIMLSAGMIPGTEGTFYIYGQQHTSKNERFTRVDTASEGVKYGLLKKSIFSSAAYSKSKIYNRKDGMFVAK